MASWTSDPPGCLDNERPSSPDKHWQQKMQKQRQLLEQKQRQKRQTTGMVQANDSRVSTSAKARPVKQRDEMRPLMAAFVKQPPSPNKLQGYDGPLQYSMTSGNPDAMSTVQVAPMMTSVPPDVINSDCDHSRFLAPSSETERKLQQLNLSSHVDYDLEDQESTPIIIFGLL